MNHLSYEQVTQNRGRAKQRLHLALNLFCLIKVCMVQGAIWKLGAGNEVDLVLNAKKRLKAQWQVFGKDISVLLQKVSNRRRNIQRWCIIKGNKRSRAYKCMAW
jgi:hypothetical protein